ncbi:Ig-like domain-containing protein [Aequorivita echinoideorum]|uniref:T9SS type A sorting domain-containing protein n=1 Tax=Aequorivita echinoideorum TaxID=1549647 RepID=A0ABS5S624_9FLAO|nr:T9SS type A sorting domain-containing protein [Aequorivita echinoideorum]MBT0607270.1 T9SS type A sorting domain-containing protein [Aequorivita echinoideorum]
MKKLYSYLSMGIMFLLSATLSAQVLLPENFEGTGAMQPVPPGWVFISSTAFESTNVTPCEGNRSVRVAISSTNANPSLRSAIQTATGDDIEISFDYKLINNPGGGATPAGFGTFDLQYTVNADATTPTYTTYAVINGSNHVPSTNCATLTHTIPAASVPAGSRFAWRIRANWASGTYFLYVDDFLAVEQVDCIAPIYLEADNITFDEADISWTDLAGATQWEIAYGVTGFPNPNTFPPGPPFSIVTGTTTNPTTLQNLIDGTVYDVYVRAICTPGAPPVASNWSGPITFQTVAIGTDCDAPITITSLPYNQTDVDTATYGNDYTGNPGNGCVGANYLQGFDVVYKYTPTSDDYLNIAISDITGENNVGVFLYTSCANIGTNCYEGSTTTTGDDFDFDVFVTGGQDYFIVVSTAGANTTTEYTIDIEGFDCATFPVPDGQSTYEFFNQQLSAFDNTNQGVEPTNDFADLNWYENNNGVPGALIPNTAAITLTNGAVYFVNQSLGTCQGPFMMVTFNEFDCLGQLAILTTDPGDEICGEGTTTLSATGNSDNLFWYTSASGGEPVGTGNTFETPNINETTSFWVSEAFVGEGNLTGQANPGPTTISTSTLNNYGVIVNAVTDFTLVNVQVFSTAGGGTTTVVLKDIGGTQPDQQATFSIPSGSTASPTPVTLTLNFELTSGSSYRLLKSVGPALVYTTAANSSFPYAVGNVGEVTSGSTSTGTSTSYYYFYNWTVIEDQPLCESPRTEVIAVVNEIFDVQATSTSPTVCVGQNATLNATSTDMDYDYTWTWNDPSGAPQTATGDQIQPTILQTTTFTVTGFNPITGCTSPPDTVEVTAIGAGDIPVTPQTVETCTGNIIELIAGGVYNDFNDMNTGWTTVNNSTGPDNPAGAGWKLVNSPYSPVGGIMSNDDSQFYISISDEVGPGGAVDTELISPPLNLVGVQSATLTFYHLYDYLETKPTQGRVEISENNGSWVTLKTYSSDVGTPAVTPKNFAFETIDLANYTGSANVRIRFRYTGQWSWWWAVDEVNITRSYTNGTITWNSTNDLFVDPNATLPYTGAATDKVYFKSDVPGTFTYNVELDIFGCSAPVTNQVVITVEETLAPTGPSNQTYSFGQTLSNLDVTGQNLKYYILEDGEYVQISPNFLLRHNTTYYITQTQNGCESEFLEVTVELDCPAPTDVDVNVELGSDGATASAVVTWNDPAVTTSVQGYLIEITDSEGTIVYSETVSGTANFEIIQGLELNESFDLIIYSVCDPEIPVYSEVESLEFDTNGILNTNDFSFNGFSYYPNPTNGIVTFKNSLPMQRLEVFSVTGQKIFEINNIDNTETELDYTSLASGVYFTVVTVGESVEVVRIIKE